MPSSFNNWMVEALRSGSATPVDTLLDLGQGPSVVLDWVNPEPDDLAAATPSPLVSSHSIWFWVHQAPRHEASRRCWDRWMVRELAQLPAAQIDKRMRDLFVEAIDAALSSGEFIPLLDTWERSLEFSQAVEGDWSRLTALQVLSSRLVRYPASSTRLLPIVEMAGLAKRSDLLAWARDPAGPWDDAASKALPDLLDALCGVCAPVPEKLLLRLEGHVHKCLEDYLRAGSGGGRERDMLPRIQKCLEVLAEQGLTMDAHRFSDSLIASISAVLANPGEWPGPAVSFLSSLRLESSLPSKAGKPTSRARM